MVTLYNVVSRDGYIATKDWSEDFIPSSYWPKTLSYLSQFDCIIIGRKTYEAIQKYEDPMRLSFDSLPVRKIVVTRDRNFQVKLGYEISYSIEESISQYRNVVVTSGPTVNDYLIDKQLVDRITYHKVPEAVGDGIRPYQNINSLIKVAELPIE
jgi:dihydrofolate reductase